MAKCRFKTQCDLRQLTDFLKESFGIAQKKERMVRKYSNCSKLDPRALHEIYIIIQNEKTVRQKVEIIAEINFENAISNWIISERAEASPGYQYLDDRTLLEIIDIFKIKLDYLSQQWSEEIDLNHELLSIQNYLTYLYTPMQRSHYQRVRSSFLECLNKIYCLRPSNIKDIIYSQLLSKSEGNNQEFFYYFNEYMNKSQQDDAVINSLIPGFSRRIKYLQQKEVLTMDQKNTILNSYQNLADFVFDNCKGPWPQKLISIHPQIFQYLKSFTNKNLKSKDLAKIFNRIIVGYMNSAINNIHKNQFILKTYLYIIQKSAPLFALIKTDFLVEHRDFIEYFAESELRFENRKQALERYLSNQYSLQFFLVLSIYYIGCFQFKMDQVKIFMRSISLLNEAKIYFELESVREYLRILYHYINQDQEFQEFVIGFDHNHHILL